MKMCWILTCILNEFWFPFGTLAHNFVAQQNQGRGLGSVLCNNAPFSKAHLVKRLAFWQKISALKKYK